MTQLSEDCFARGEPAAPLMSAGEALGLLRARIVCVAGTESVALVEALGRILARDVVSARDVPPHDNAAVDGYAVYFDDLAPGQETRLPVEGRAAAGHPLGRPANRGSAIRIFTGAPMPEGSGGGPDTVLMQEDCVADGGVVAIPPGIKRGANRRRAGEDVVAGATILRAGQRLRPQDVGLAASIGCTELAVRAPLRVAVFSTGDELREPGAPTPPGTVHDSNRYALIALVKDLGARVADMGILPDRYGPIRDALLGAAPAHDLLLCSGGMSTGEEDHVVKAVTELGRLHFWRLAIKPGRPVALGQIGRTPIVGLPGNPAAMMVTFMHFARPLVLGLGGATELEPVAFRVRAGFAYRKKGRRREWLRARLTRGPDGAPVAHRFPREGAGILSSLVESDGLVELAEELTGIEAGDMVDFIPFSGLR